MSKKLYIKPPAPTRSLLIAQIIIVSLFLPFGAGLTLLSEGEARPFALIFGVIWIAGCLAIIIHAFKALRLVKEGKIEIAEFSDTSDETLRGGFADRLRRLENFRKEGLISEDEDKKKRDGIMQEKW